MGECVPEMLRFLCVSPALPKTVFGFAGWARALMELDGGWDSCFYLLRVVR